MTGIIRFGRNALGWGPPSSPGWRRSGTTDIPAAGLPSPSPVVPPPPLPPTLLTAPTISDVNNPPQVGDLITATHGTYIGTVTGYSGQWYSAGVPILGVTDLTYIVQLTDLGNALVYRESALNGGLSSAVGVSNSLGLVVAGFGSFDLSQTGNALVSLLEDI